MFRPFTLWPSSEVTISQAPAVYETMGCLRKSYGGATSSIQVTSVISHSPMLANIIPCRLWFSSLSSFRGLIKIIKSVAYNSQGATPVN